MTTPTIYTPEQIRSEPMCCIARGLPDGRWVACRPEGWGGPMLRHRLRCAWLVFTGRADVLRWEDQPPTLRAKRAPQAAAAMNSARPNEQDSISLPSRPVES